MKAPHRNGRARRFCVVAMCHRQDGYRQTCWSRRGIHRSI